MEILLDSNRIILALGYNLVSGGGQTIEPVTEDDITRVRAANDQKIGDGTISISSDHQTLTINPPSAAYLQLVAARTAKQSLIAQHKAALAALYASTTGDSTQISTDLSALKTIAAALAAGTQPTAAQQTIIDRVLVRLLILLNS